MVLAVKILVLVIFIQFEVDSKSFDDGIEDAVEPAQVMTDGVEGFNDPI
jgi:hypothetical protein